MEIKKLYLKKKLMELVFIHPETKKFIKGKYLERIKDLDEIPSPYLTGLLENFLMVN